MPIGLALLLAVGALIYFGLAQRVLDRMRLTDKGALAVVGLLILGSFVDIPIVRDRLDVSVNVGGALIPLLLVIYLLYKADETKEVVRSLVAALVTGAVIYGTSQLVDFDTRPEAAIWPIDPIWAFGLIAGVVGYLAGRSRRASFIAGVSGILLTDLAHLIRAIIQDVPATVAIGGAGAFDAIVLAGLIAVGLAEIVGEIRERLASGGGGPDEK